MLGAAGVCTRECFAVVADTSLPVEVRIGLNRGTGHDALKSRPAMPQVMAGDVAAGDVANVARPERPTSAGDGGATISVVPIS
jgi:hypothetical protein